MMNPFAVLASAARRSIRGIFVLVLVTLYAPPEEEPQEEPESRSELIHELQTALAAAGRTYLGGLAGEQMVALVQKTFSQVLNAVAGSLAAGLNVALEYVLQSMQAAGVQLSTLDKVTPQVVIFGIQCVLLALIGYWLLSFVYRIISPPLWRALKLVKKIIALATGVPFQLDMVKSPFRNKEKKQNAQKEGKEGKQSKQGKQGKEAPEGRREEKSSFFKFFKKNKKQA